jgi:hypothetical protein
MAKNSLKNNQKTIFKLFIIFSFLFSIIFIYSITNFSNIGSLAGLIIVLSILFSIGSIISVFIFKKRSDAIEKAIKENRFITKWIYEKEEWKNFLYEEYKIKKIEKKLIFWILSMITILVFAIFILIIKEARSIMLLVLLGLLILFFIVSRLIPYIDYFYKKKQKHYVLILEKGIYIAGHFHFWDFPLSKLSLVKLKNKPIKHLLITYDFFDRLGPRDYSLMVPIPKKENEKKILKIINDLKKSNKLK